MGGFVMPQRIAISDQNELPIILPFVQVVGSTTTTAAVVIDDYTFIVTDTTGMIAGQHVRLIDPAGDRFYFGTITNITDSTITVDTPFDYGYSSGSEVTFSNKNMNVSGSTTTPMIFQGRTGTISIPSGVDITRIIFSCITDTPVDLSLFGDLEALTNGLALRVIKNGYQYNVFNVKTNADISGLCYDFDVFQALNPAQGVDGFKARITFAGQNKMGVAIRLEQDENIEILIQDDLTGLTELFVVIEGHVAKD